MISYSNLSNEEWHALRFLAGNRSIVIKNADKRSSVTVSDHIDHIKEGENN